jgi:hypothetical protein
VSLLLLAPLRLDLPDAPELHLYPPSLAEREGRPPTALATLARFDAPPAQPPVHARLETLLAGTPPDEEALANDARSLIGLHDADAFLRFTHLAASASGQIVDQSEWARSCGVTHTTVARWLNALERAFHILQLPPVTVDDGSRQVRRRKLYCLNPVWAHTASRFEAWAVAEIVKSFAHRAQPAEFRHWTLAAGAATGMIAETAEAAISVSVTRLPTAPPNAIAAAQKWCRLAPHHAACVLTTGAAAPAFGPVKVHPWWRL